MELRLLEPDMAPFVELAKMVLLLADWDNVVCFDACDKNRGLYTDDLVSISALPLDTGLSRRWNVGDDAKAALLWIVSRDGKRRILLAMELDTREGAALVVASAVEHFEEQCDSQVEEMIVCALSVFHVMTIRVRRSQSPEDQDGGNKKKIIAVARSTALPLVSLWWPSYCEGEGEVRPATARDGFDCLVSYLRSKEDDFRDIDILGQRFRNAAEAIEWFEVALWPGTKILSITSPEERSSQQVKAQIAGIGDLPLMFVYVTLSCRPFH